MVMHIIACPSNICFTEIVQSYAAVDKSLFHHDPKSLLLVATAEKKCDYLLTYLLNYYAWD